MTCDDTIGLNAAVDPRRKKPHSILVHVGYPKTGTTFLQTEVFRDDSEAWFPLDRLGATEALVKPFALEFDLGSAHAFFEKEFARQSPGDVRVPVLSQEGLVNVLWAYGARSIELADRLHALLCEEARVLIVIREQRNQILSHFAHYRSKGGTLGIRQFLEMDSVPDSHAPVFRYSLYEYDRLVRHYQSLFGEDKVLITTAEQLQSEPRGVLLRVYEFAGAPTTEIDSLQLHARYNASPSVARLKAHRLSARFGKPSSLRPDARSISPLRLGLLGVEKALDAAVPSSLDRHLRDRRWRIVNASVGSRFAASNSRLATLTGLPLRDLGYACE